MIIGIDCRLWNETGVGRYTKNLVLNLGKIDKKNEYVLFAKSQDYTKIRSSVKNSNFTIQNTDIGWHGLAEQAKFPLLLSKTPVNFMHFPYFSVPILYRKPFIVTIHDLIVNSHKTGRASTLPYPLYLAKRIGYSIVIASAMSNAKKIITPSNSVKEEILSKYKNLNSEKINVIYEGGFENVKAVSKSNSVVDVEGRFLLRVGNFYPHKNVEKLIKGFRDLLYDNYENHDLKLVLVGKKDYFYKRIEFLIEDGMLEDNVVLIENIDDDKLISLYNDAIVTIIPSLAEGFSLTGVEAMSCGSPVLASDIATHREIFGKGALYCNPMDTNDIKQKIAYLVELPEKERELLISEGKKQAGKYSWEKMAEETLAIYENTSV